MKVFVLKLRNFIFIFLIYPPPPPQFYISILINESSNESQLVSSDIPFDV